MWIFFQSTRCNGYFYKYIKIYILKNVPKNTSTQFYSIKRASSLPPLCPTPLLSGGGVTSSLHFCPSPIGLHPQGPRGTLSSQLELNQEAGWQGKVKLGTPGDGHDPGRVGERRLVHLLRMGPGYMIAPEIEVSSPLSP